VKAPAVLQALIEDAVIDRVVNQLQSGKEAEVYVVACGDEMRCAKVYKSSEHRSFKQVATYREGRRARGSRDRRASGKRTSHGVKVQESQWKTAEIEALYRLADAGVRVPRPYGIYDGVLLMELVQQDDGTPANRLNDIEMSAAQACEWHALMIRQITLMLCAGIIHGDLSEFNVLLGPDGPVIIDLPQAVDAAGNNNAFRMLERDVNNMRATFARAAPELAQTEFAKEIWDLYEAGDLQPDSVLSGQHRRIEQAADVDAVMEQIDEARYEAEARALGREDAASSE